MNDAFTATYGPSIGSEKFKIIVMNVESLETMEFAYANTVTNYATAQRSTEEIRDYIRDVLRTHRSTVICWLVENGAQIPGGLQLPETHPEVGKQSVDDEKA